MQRLSGIDFGSCRPRSLCSQIGNSPSKCPAERGSGRSSCSPNPSIHPSFPSINDRAVPGQRCRPPHFSDRRPYLVESRTQSLGSSVARLVVLGTWTRSRESDECPSRTGGGIQYTAIPSKKTLSAVQSTVAGVYVSWSRRVRKGGWEGEGWAGGLARRGGVGEPQVQCQSVKRNEELTR